MNALGVIVLSLLTYLAFLLFLYFLPKPKPPVIVPTLAIKQETAAPLLKNPLWGLSPLRHGETFDGQSWVKNAPIEVSAPKPATPLLSPRAEKIVDNILIAIGCCIGGIILAALAIVFGLFFGQLRRDYRHRRYINNRYG